MKKKKGPIIGIFDLETSPLISYHWGLFDQNIPLNQIVQDRHILSFAFKFLGEKKIYYFDQRNQKDITNDKLLLEKLRKLLEQCDIVIGQNSISYDTKFVKSRMIIHNMKPLTNFKQIDTMRIAKKHFNFTSNKLEYLSKSICPNQKKSTHKKFPGFELWKECLKGNKAAWNEMKKYNIQDVVSTEALYNRLQPYDTSINFNVYSDDFVNKCNCGGNEFIKRGFNFSTVGKYQRYQCKSCGACFSSKENLLPKEKRKNLLKAV